MINLNKKCITKKDLLNHLSYAQIYSAYLDGAEFKLNKAMLSPLRKEAQPSFGFVQNETGEIFFKDFVLGSGDIIEFVRLKFGIQNYFEILSKIASDFNLPDKDFFYKKSVSHIDVTKALSVDEDLLRQSSRSQINVTFRDFNKDDALFWSSFGITYNIIKYYNVRAISHIHINDKIVKADKYAYVFIENKDDRITYKIYQPFNKRFKWLSTHDNSVWQGWEQLPDKHHSLIITKSLKDVMSIVSITGIPATALQSENVKPKEHVFNELRERFSEIYLLYDNDWDKETNWGEMLGDELYDAYDFDHRIKIPDGAKCTDFAEIVTTYGVERAKRFIDNHLLPF